LLVHFKERQPTGRRVSPATGHSKFDLHGRAFRYRAQQNGRAADLGGHVHGELLRVEEGRAAAGRKLIQIAARKLIHPAV